MRVFDFSVEGELGTWTEAHGRSAVINSGKTPCGHPRKLGHDKLVCEPSRTGCDGVQTIVTLDRLLSMRWLHSSTRTRDLSSVSPMRHSSVSTARRGAELPLGVFRSSGNGPRRPFGACIRPLVGSGRGQPAPASRMFRRSRWILPV